MEIPAPRPDKVYFLPTPSPDFTAATPTQRDAALVIEDLKEALQSCNADKAAAREAIWPLELK